jgi:uncharacterized membrane-anchored protein YitT (DUF2179 family)
MHKREARVDWKHIFHPAQLIVTILGVACAVFAMRGFMMPNALMDGGVTGVSILIYEIYHVNISMLIIGFNLVFIYLGYKHIGKTFAVQTSIAVLLLAIGLQYATIPAVTNDKLLIAVFGGFFIGIGMGLVIRAGGVIDGAEIIAIFSTKKLSISISEVIMGFNSLIFLMAAINLGIESAMYSIITYFTATRMSDYVVDGFEEYIALNIVSAQHEAIKSALVNDLKKGIVVFKGERGYLPGSFDKRENVDIVVTIITRLELLKIKDAIYEIDSKAFMFVNSVKEARGGVLKKKHGH